MKHKTPQITYIYDRYKKAFITKKASIEMRISYDYKQKYISTSIQVLPNQWKNGRIVGTPDASILNQALDKMYSEVRTILYNMEEEGDIDIFSIPDKLRELHGEKITFMYFCKQRAKVRKYGKSKDTQERYDRFIERFQAYGKIKRFQDITEANIIAYDQYLSSKGGKRYSIWQNYHRFLNSFIIDAVDAGYIRRNPYRWIVIDKKGTSNGLDKCLTQKEFNKLVKAKMPTECLERIKDLFIFQTYTCLRYSDLVLFDTDNIKIVKDTMVYSGNSQKTDKPFTIPLLQPAIDILKKYDGKLPIVSNSKYNEHLKVVAQAAGIDVPLSTHWARHTGATMLLNRGVDMRIVSKICGHSSTRITEQVYAKLLDETVIEAVRALDKKNSRISQSRS